MTHKWKRKVQKISIAWQKKRQQKDFEGFQLGIGNDCLPWIWDWTAKQIGDALNQTGHTPEKMPIEYVPVTGENLTNVPPIPKPDWVQLEPTHQYRLVANYRTSTILDLDINYDPRNSLVSILGYCLRKSHVVILSHRLEEKGYKLLVVKKSKS